MVVMWVKVITSLKFKLGHLCIMATIITIKCKMVLMFSEPSSIHLELTGAAAEMEEKNIFQKMSKQSQNDLLDTAHLLLWIVHLCVCMYVCVLVLKQTDMPTADAMRRWCQRNCNSCKLCSSELTYSFSPTMYVYVSKCVYILCMCVLRSQQTWMVSCTAHCVTLGNLRNFHLRGGGNLEKSAGSPCVPTRNWPHASTVQAVTTSICSQRHTHLHAVSIPYCSVCVWNHIQGCMLTHIQYLSFVMPYNNYLFMYWMYVYISWYVFYCLYIN